MVAITAILDHRGCKEEVAYAMHIVSQAMFCNGAAHEGPYMRTLYYSQTIPLCWVYEGRFF